MATRASNLSPMHVEALNSIDLNFTSSTIAEREVREAWKEYLNWLGQRDVPGDQWGIRRVDLLTDLLQKMGRALNYEFDKTHIKTAIYSPTLHGRIEADQEAIRQGLRHLLEGRLVLPLHVVNLHPPQPDDGAQQQEM